MFPHTLAIPRKIKDAAPIPAQSAGEQSPSINLSQSLFFERQKWRSLKRREVGASAVRGRRKETEI